MVLKDIKDFFAARTPHEVNISILWIKLPFAGFEYVKVQSKVKNAKEKCLFLKNLF